MFKAIDTQSNIEVISLDITEAEALDILRQRSRIDLLRCPVCNQSVVFRAGEINRPHFAHKDLDACPSGKESVDLLQARAVLYEWLKSRLSDGVTLEKQLDNSSLPRPVDCWVETRRGLRIAYWIVVGRMNDEEFAALSESVHTANATLRFVFLAKKMKRREYARNVIYLSRTERGLIRFSEYDHLHLRYHYGILGSMSYLDADERVMHTFRGLYCTEPPQQHEGVEFVTRLDELKIDFTTGEFIHVGEPDTPQRLKDAIAAKHARPPRTEGGVARSRWPQAAPMADAVRTPPIERSSFTTSPAQPPQESTPDDEDAIPDDKEGVCEFCGQVTKDWWTRNGATGMCKCNDCLKQGKT